MKNMMFLFFPLFLFVACSQKESTINIAAQSALMKDDPIVIEYFAATAASSKIITEGGVDMTAYQAILKQHSQDICKVSMDIFNGNTEMEDLTKVNCRVKTSAITFHNKYPFVEGLSKEEKRELFTPLIQKPDYDMEKIKRNAGKHTEN